MATTTKMLEMLDPTAAEGGIAHHNIAPRVDSLQGKVFGFLDNSKSNFNYLLDDIEAILQEKYPTATVIRRRKASVQFPCPQDTMKELLEKCDVIITGSGD